MARNGSGTYSRIVETPYVYGTTIDETVVNGEFNDIATALTASIAKDGQTTPTANLPMGTYRHTGVGAATVRTSYARAAEVQDGALTVLGTVAGTNAVTAAASLSMSAYAVGQVFQFVPAATNTGAATLNINSIGAGAVQLNGKALVGGELVSGVPVQVFVSATTPVFQIIGNGALMVEPIRTDIASASTLDLSAVNGRSLNVTGTTETTAITLGDGQTRLLRANGAWPITHGASLICPGSASYTCAAGDLVMAVGEPAGVVRLAIWKSDGTSSVSLSSKVNNFRLTLTAGVPVTTSDVTAAGTIYCCPYNGNQISLYTGGAWVTRTSAQFSLALSSLTSGKPYDVYCYDNSGTPTLEFLVWTNDTTRATALAYQDGVLVKSGDATRRYIGTFYTTGTTTTEDSAAKRYLENYANQVDRVLSGTFSADRVTSSATYVELNSEIRIKWVQGVAENPVTLSVNGGSVAGSYNCPTAVAIDSTTVATAGFETSNVTSAAGKPVPLAINNRALPSIGSHYATLLGATDASTSTWFASTVIGSKVKVYLSGIKKG